MRMAMLPASPARMALVVMMLTTTAYGYMLDPASPAGWGFSSVVDGIPFSPIGVFPYVNSAGISKLMVSDSPNPVWVYNINDVDWQTSPTHIDEASNSVTWAALGGMIYLSGDNLVTVDGNGYVHNYFSLQIEGTECFQTGIVANPFNNHLYIACANLLAILDVDAAKFDVPDDMTYNLEDGAFGVLISPENIACDNDNGFLLGLAFSEDYQTLFSVCVDDESPASYVNGFAIDPREGVVLDLIYQSSVYPSGPAGVVAGTGCLKDFIYVSTLDGLLQIDIHGVQTPILTGGVGGFLVNDPLDGSLLLPIFDDESMVGGVVRVVAPACGGFAGPRRFFAPGAPVDSGCEVSAECSTDSCVENTCTLSTYLGHCQTDEDCNDPEAELPNGFWCLLWRDPHADERHHHHRRRPRVGGLPSRPARTESKESVDFIDRFRRDRESRRSAKGKSASAKPARVNIDASGSAFGNAPQFKAISQHWWQQHGDEDGEGEHGHNRNRFRERLRGRPPFVEVEAPSSEQDFFPSRFGVCILNSCSIAAVCDEHATCKPVGDGTHVCKCNEGYYGNGLPGHCANPCAGPANGGCADADIAICSSTSPTDIHCECVPGMAGDGHTCFTDSCIGADPGCATDSEAHAAFCHATSNVAYTCTCGADYWQPTPGGFCYLNACVTANYCDEHATCTPSGTMDSQATCTCNDGYKNTNMPPPSPNCVAATCIPLSPGTFPLNQIDHAIIGTCVGLVTGQTCQVGCGPGFKPKGSTFTTCTPSPGRPTSYYSVPQFECIPVEQKDSKHGGHHHKEPAPTPKPKPSPDGAPPAWLCPIGQQCRPLAPSQVLPKRPTSIKLHWVPLQNSPNGDVVSSLVVSILPSGTSLTTYSSPISNPSYTNSITITGLTSGQTYTFRLVVTLMGSGQVVAGEPFVVTL